MLFNSLHFFIFFPIVCALYFSLPYRFRWMLLLAASYYFYMCWNPAYIILILYSTTNDYFAGLMMERSKTRRARMSWLGVSLCANLGMLFFFKYYNFARASLLPILQYANVDFTIPESSFLLPVGISFYTFQSLSYTIDVYRGKIHAERHPGIFAVYITFFPQLVAGPIERAITLLPQFYEKHDFDYKRVTDGLKLIIWGLFKKVVIADRLAMLVDRVYTTPGDFDGFSYTVATVAFAFQIFCDFSGYSDMAIGTAEVLGFRLMMNFKRPYLATSIADFWHRWHISLSTWFRDYVYFSLGGNRVSPVRRHLNILAVFLVSGIWHGADWKFLIWGALHGTYMVVGGITQPFRSRVATALGMDALPMLHRAIQIVVTFVLVCIAWVFFRANSTADAWMMLTHFYTGWGNLLGWNTLLEKLYTLGLGRDELPVAAFIVPFLYLMHIWQERVGGIRECVARWPLPARWAAYSFLLWLIFLFGIFRHREFIYFTF